MNIAVTDGRISQMIAAGVGAGDHAADGKGALTPGVAGIVVVAPLLSLLYGAIRSTYFEVKLPPKPK